MSMVIQTSLRDFAKIGVLLIGISLLVIAVVVVHFYVFYFTKITSSTIVERLFTAYCSMSKAVVISANRDLEEVTVLDNRSIEVCRFKNIQKNSQEVCMVEDYGIYIVKYGDFKNVVECYKPATVIISGRPEEVD
ncbi:MAG: hypothetical protein QXE67_02720 [Nitrososphaerota archaeon]